MQEEHLPKEYEKIINKKVPEVPVPKVKSQKYYPKLEKRCETFLDKTMKSSEGRDIKAGREFQSSPVKAMEDYE